MISIISVVLSANFWYENAFLGMFVCLDHALKKDRIEGMKEITFSSSRLLRCLADGGTLRNSFYRIDCCSVCVYNPKT